MHIIFRLVFTESAPVPTRRQATKANTNPLQLRTTLEMSVFSWLDKKCLKLVYSLRRSRIYITC